MVRFFTLFLAMITLNVFAVDPVYRAGFDQNTFAQTGWTVFPAGTGEFSPAPVIISAIPSSFDDPIHTNGRGVLVSAQNGQGSLVLGPVVQTNGDLAVLSVSILTSSAEAIVAVGGLDVAPDGTIATVDGSATYAFEANSSAFVDGYNRVRVLYQPKSGAFIPIFQVAVSPGKNNEFVTAMVDNFEVHLLNKNVVTDPELQTLFGLAQTSPVPTATPTRTPTVTSTPTRTATPTRTPTIPAQTDPVVQLAQYDLANNNDNADSLYPAVSYDTRDDFVVVAVDQRSGFDDISLWNIGTEPKLQSAAFLVNETFEDTSAAFPDVDVNSDRVRHIVWIDNRSVEKLDSVYLAQYDVNGNRYGTRDFEVNRLFVDTNTKSPAVYAPDDNEILVTWIDDRNFVNDVFARRLRWENNLVDPLNEEDFQINIPFENTIAQTPDIVGDPDGNVIAVWSDNRLIVGDTKRFDIYARVFRLDTQILENSTLPDSAPEIMLSLFDDVPDDHYDPSIAYGADSGLFVAVWENFMESRNSGQVQAAVIDSSGEIVERLSNISDSVSGDFVRFPDVTSLGNGQFLITWQIEEDTAVYGRLYDAGTNRYKTPVTQLTPATSSNVSKIGTWQRIAGWNGNTFLSVFDLERPTGIDVSAFAGRLLNIDPVGTIPAKVLQAKVGGSGGSNVSIKSESNRQTHTQKEVRKETGHSFRR